MLLLGLCKWVCAGVSYQQSGFTRQSPGNPCKLTAWLLPAARLNKELCSGHATARALQMGVRWRVISAVRFHPPEPRKSM
jgi:hypothetical protein